LTDNVKLYLILGRSQKSGVRSQESEGAPLLAAGCQVIVATY